LLVAGFLAIAAFYYWINWSTELPVLGGDHAAYLLMADYFSPFSDRNHEVMRAATAYSFFPPLYPLILGLIDATSAHIEIAHAVTVTFLLAALVWFFVWAQHETGSMVQAFLLAAIFALLPTTFFQSFGILSENLYLLLTLVAIWLLARQDVSLSRLYIASMVIGLAAITRTVGVALILAFAIYLFIHHRKQLFRFTLISLIPVFTWSAVKRLLEFEGGYSWMISGFADVTSISDLLWNKLLIEGHGLWAGWITSFDPVPSLMTLIVGSIVCAICLAGSVHRAYLGKFDGIYLIIYLGVLLLWPSAPDAKRFLYVIFPILLLHGFQLISHVIRRFSVRSTAIYGYVYILVIALSAFPATGIIIQRLASAAQQENSEYAKSLYWYSGSNVKRDLDRARLKIAVYKKYILSWRRIADSVPEGECVYSVDPTWLMLYADRASYATPRALTQDEFLVQASRCRFIYVASYTRVPYSVFYPREYLQTGRIVFTDRVEDVNGRPILGMLLELPRKGHSFMNGDDVGDKKK